MPNIGAALNPAPYGARLAKCLTTAREEYSDASQKRSHLRQIELIFSVTGVGCLNGVIQTR